MRLEGIGGPAPAVPVLVFGGFDRQAAISPFLDPQPSQVDAGEPDFGETQRPGYPSEAHPFDQGGFPPFDRAQWTAPAGGGTGCTCPGGVVMCRMRAAGTVRRASADQTARWRVQVSTKTSRR